MTDLLTDQEIEQRIEAAKNAAASAPFGTENTVPAAAPANEDRGAPSLAAGVAAAGGGVGVRTATDKGSVRSPTEPSPPRYRYLHPLSEAATNLVETLQNVDGRYMFGLREIDLMMRGVGKGQLCYITGRSHSGKTQLFLHSVLFNAERPIVLFTPDETAEEVLAKLVCCVSGSNMERIEEQVRKRDAGAVEKVKRIAASQLSNLLVVDETLDLKRMFEAVKEAEHYFGEPPSAVALDYLGLMPGADVSVDSGAGATASMEKKSQELSNWTKSIDLPVVCIHQGSRSNSGGGQKLGLDAMMYAGENEGKFVLGVRRKRDDIGLEGWDRRRHENTISVSVIKNKRPPSKRGEHDYFLDPDCGTIRDLKAGDLDVGGAPLPPRVGVGDIMEKMAPIPRATDNPPMF